MINIPDVLDDNSALSDLLVAFQPIEFPKCIFQGMELIPAPGSIGYFYVGAFSFLEGIYDIGMLVPFVFSVAAISLTFKIFWYYIFCCSCYLLN